MAGDKPLWGQGAVLVIAALPGFEEAVEPKVHIAELVDVVGRSDGAKSPSPASAIGSVSPAGPT